LQKLRSEFHKAETAAVIFEADLVQKEMGSRVLMLLGGLGGSNDGINDSMGCFPNGILMGLFVEVGEVC